METKTVDIASLELLCDKLECGDANHRATAAQIRKAMKKAKPQLPEGIEWPRFEDGELVNFGDEFVDFEGETHFVGKINFDEMGNFFIECGDWSGVWGKGEPVKRPEPEVLDADGVPINVGDTVWLKGSPSPFLITAIDVIAGFGRVQCNNSFWNYSSLCSHRKTDTQEDIDDDLTMPPWKYCEIYGIEIESGSDEATTVEAMCRHLLERQRKLMGGE